MFLCLYGALALGWALMLRGARARLVRGIAGGNLALTEYELGALNGGAELAVTAAATRLRSLGVLEPGDRPHTLRVVSDPRRLVLLVRLPGRPAAHLSVPLARDSTEVFAPSD